MGAGAGEGADGGAFRVPSRFSAAPGGGGGDSDDASARVDDRLSMLERLVGKLAMENRELKLAVDAAPAGGGRGSAAGGASSADVAELSQRLKSLERIVARDNRRVDDLEQQVTNNGGGSGGGLSGDGASGAAQVVSGAIDKMKAVVDSATTSFNEQLDVERKKAALLYAELTRLGQTVDGVSASAPTQHAALEARVASLDAAVRRHAALLGAQEDRERSKFDAIGTESDAMARRVAELGDELQRVRAELNAEASEHDVRACVVGRMCASVPDRSPHCLPSFYRCAGIQSRTTTVPGGPSQQAEAGVVGHWRQVGCHSHGNHQQNPRRTRQLGVPHAS